MWDLGFDRRFKIGKGPSSRENHMEMANEGKGERVAGGWGVRVGMIELVLSGS